MKKMNLLGAGMAFETFDAEEIDRFIAHCMGRCD
jgi:hypothetical protein